MVEEVNIFGDNWFQLLKGRNGDMAEGFFFEMAEEVLHRGIVPTVSPPRHGGRNVILLGKGMIRL